MDNESYSKILSYAFCELTMPVKRHACSYLASDQNILNHHLLSAAGIAVFTKSRPRPTINTVRQNKLKRNFFRTGTVVPERTCLHNNLSNHSVDSHLLENSAEESPIDINLVDQKSRPTMSSQINDTSTHSKQGATEEMFEISEKSKLEHSESQDSSVNGENGCVQEFDDNMEEHVDDAIESLENDYETVISDDTIVDADSDPFLNLTENDFKHTFKVSRSTFENLVEFLSNEEMEPIENIPLYKKLLIVLWLLGNSSSYRGAAETFNVTEEAAANCFFDVCATLYNHCDNIITWPDFDECNDIATRIEKNYGFAGVVGVLGCRYFSISIPKETFSRREHFNAKQKTYCIALQIVCDDNLMIRDIFPGLPGGVTEAQIFCRSPLFEQLTSKTQPVQLIDSHKHILARSLYPQLKSVLTPYTQNLLSQEELELNDLHETVCKLVDQTLQMLQERFSTLKLLDPEVATMVLVVACVIHNFCIGNGDVFGTVN